MMRSGGGKLRKLAALLCALALSLSGVMPASAGMIGSAELLAGEGHRQTVESFLSRQDVQRELVALGVNPADAQARVAAMSEAELAELAGRIESAPAGAGVVEIVGVVFIVLIILELTGVTNVFTSF